MTQAASAEDRELRVEALELTLELVIGLLQPTHQAGQRDVEAALQRRWRAEAPRVGADPPSREWQVVGRALERLQAGSERTGGARLDEL